MSKFTEAQADLDSLSMMLANEEPGGFEGINNDIAAELCLLKWAQKYLPELREALITAESI